MCPDDEKIINLIKKRTKPTPTEWKGLDDTMKKEINNIHSRLIMRKTAIGVSILATVALVTVIYLNINQHIHKTQPKGTALAPTPVHTLQPAGAKTASWGLEKIDQMETDLENELSSIPETTQEIEDIGGYPPTVDSIITDIEIELRAITEQPFWSVK